MVAKYGSKIIVNSFIRFDSLSDLDLAVLAQRNLGSIVRGRRKAVLFF